MTFRARTMDGFPRRSALTVATCVFAGCAVLPDDPVLAPGLRVTQEPVQQEPVQEVPAEDEVERSIPPRPVVEGDDDWLRLVSGEWLRGEITSMNDEVILFDSEELDDLELDWEDVDEVVTARTFTLAMDDRSTLVGVPWFHGGQLSLRTAEGEVELPRDHVLGFRSGAPREANYWSGDVSIGLTLRKGNTDQVESVFAAHTLRRTSLSRLTLGLESLYGTLEGSENVDNQTFQGKYDLYLSDRLFATPVALEVFRDPFQNIDLRVAPGAGVGYTFVDTADIDWEGSAGVGYRFTRFDSVAAGEPDTDETSTGNLATAYSQDITNDIELELSYAAQIGLEDAANTNQNARLQLSFDFIWDLEFDVTLVWKYVGQPAPDENGVVPEKNDLRLDVGFSWEF